MSTLDRNLEAQVSVALLTRQQAHHRALIAAAGGAGRLALVLAKPTTEVSGLWNRRPLSLAVPWALRYLGQEWRKSHAPNSRNHPASDTADPPLADSA